GRLLWPCRYSRHWLMQTARQPDSSFARASTLPNAKTDLRSLTSMFQTVEQVELSRRSTSRSSRVVLTTVAVIVATTVLLVGGVLLLPHDRYLRFKSSTDSEYAKFGWIYERIHFDRRPIDIAFFGDSHIMLGVDSTLVEQSFTNASGQAVNVVN